MIIDTFAKFKKMKRTMATVTNGNVSSQQKDGSTNKERVSTIDFSINDGTDRSSEMMSKYNRQIEFAVPGIQPDDANNKPQPQTRSKRPSRVVIKSNSLTNIIIDNSQ